MTGNGYFKIGGIILGPQSEDDPDPGPKNAEWKKTNVVVIKEIPGKGKKFKTVRTSDEVLWTCTLTVRSITNTRYKELKALVDDGGPFETFSNHGVLNMYVTEGVISHTESDKEPPLTLDSDGKTLLNVATWTLQLQEAND